MAGEGFKAFDVYGDVHVDASSVDGEIREVAGKAGSSADRGGKDIGDKLSQGIQMSMVRNSPMIAAAVGAGLALGAPVAIAGAGLMFAGIAAVALRNNQQIVGAFQTLGDDIQSSAAQDAAVLVPTFTKMASSIADAFNGLRPQMRAAFSDTAPLIDSVTQGVIHLAQNAMPGLLSAVGSAGPVFTGLESALGSIGTGIGQFFQILSTHSSAAGQVFESLGSIIGSVLPILGQFMGTGVELASEVLPPLAAVLGVVASALQAISPILPIVAAGFAAFKIAGTVTGVLDKFGASIGGIKDSVGSVTKPVGEASGAMGKMGAAGTGLLGVLGGPWGIAVAGISVGMSAVSNQMQQSKDLTDKWTQSLLTGADSSATLKKQYQDQFGGTQPDWLGRIAEHLGFASSLDDAAKKAQDLYSKMTPLEQAQNDLTKATNQAKQAAQDYGANSPQHVAALAAVDSATANVTDKQNALNAAMTGVNTAMLNQANLALAAANADFAYRQSAEQTSDAMTAYTQAVKDHGAASEEATDAGMALEGAMRAQASAAGKLATDALPASTSETKKNEAAITAQLGEMYKLRDQYGSALPAGIANTIGQLESSTSSGQRAAAQFNSLTGAIVAVPSSKSVIVSSTSDEQKAKLQALGYTVQTLPNGNVLVTASTAAAEAAMNNAARNRTSVVTQTVRTVYTYTGNAIQANGHTVANATGGIVKMFASGGFEPMQQGIAKIVPPGTMRIIGDNPTSDEAYIPINNSARSQAILAQTAQRMGYGQTQQSSAGVSIGTLQLNVNGTFDFANPVDKKRFIEEINDGLVRIKKEYS